MSAQKSPPDAARRELVVTAANIRHSHVYIGGHYDFFPADCIGPVRRSKASSSPQIAIQLDGLGQTIHTDIGINGSTGKPRGQFRSRAWVRPFFQHHHIAPGDRLLLERIAERTYRLRAVAKNGDFRPRAAEFFAGIGLVRLALERQNWDVVFANDIDPDKSERIRHNRISLGRQSIPCPIASPECSSARQHIRDTRRGRPHRVRG